jgi:hypothetical protein
MALVDVEGVFYAIILVGGTRQATAATKWASIPACSGIAHTSNTQLIRAGSSATNSAAGLRQRS